LHCIASSHSGKMEENIQYNQRY